MEATARGYGDVPARQLLGDDRSADRSAGTARTTRTAMMKASVTALCATLLGPLPSRALEAQPGVASSAESRATAPTSNQGDDLPQFALAGPKGFGFASQDGSFNLILHWLLQSDFRSFLTNLPTPERDTFIVRFAGFRLDAILYRK